MTSLPSCPRMAISRASASKLVNTPRSLDKVVTVIVSQGIPVMRFGDLVSLSRFTCIQTLLYRI